MLEVLFLVVLIFFYCIRLCGWHCIMKAVARAALSQQ